MLEAGMLKRWRLAPAVMPSSGGEGSETTTTAVAAGVSSASRDLGRKLGVAPLVAQMLCRRGFDTRERAELFLKPKLTHLHDPALIPGLDRAAQRLAQAARDQQPIVIYGDYDVDGVTASAILWHTLKEASAQVQTYVPHRIEEGYGLNCEAIAQLCQSEKGKPKPLIVSVDCGITALEPARVAREMGVDLIITDHHEFDPQRLPDAHTLVHPRLAQADARDGGKGYPFPHLCGAGVAFKLAWQFCKVFCGSERLPVSYRELLLDLLSLAALGSVADVVPLVDENRVITTYGLGQIKRTRFAGLNALIDASRLRDEKIDAYHVGFVLGPRLNACGRMGHAKQAVHMLTAAGKVEAVQIAEFLTQENDRRRATERQIFDEAKQMVLEQGYDSDQSRAIVLGKEGWHPGVVGIVASRLVEAFARPVVMLNIDNGEAHGSARSVEGVSIHEAISHCGDLLTSFGGHAMAAGLRLPSGRVEEFRRRLVEFVNARLSADELVNVLEIEAVCTLDDLTLETVEQVGRLAPFGPANRCPVLCVRSATLEQAARRMGNAGRHLNLMIRQGKRTMRAVAWNMGDLAEKLPAGARVDVAFEAKVAEWQGIRKAEMHIRDLRILRD